MKKIKIAGPIPLADGDWILSCHGNKTVLYNHYPRDKQLSLKYPKRFDSFGNGRYGWDHFLNAVGIFLHNNAPSYQSQILSDLNRLRLRLS